MPTSEDSPRWAGWANADTALYLAPLEHQPERIGLWLQVEAAVYLLAVFEDARWAQIAQDWLEAAFGDVATANRLLVEQLGAVR